MLKRDHQRIVRQINAKHKAALAAAQAMEAEAQEVVETYAAALDRQDKIILAQTAALQVIRLDPRIREFLLEKDPKALAQVAEAAEMAPEFIVELGGNPAPETP